VDNKLSQLGTTAAACVGYIYLVVGRDKVGGEGIILRDLLKQIDIIIFPVMLSFVCAEHC